VTGTTTAAPAVARRGRALLGRMRRDVHVVLERDPAARTTWEVALLYPGVHAVWAHRVSHWLWARGALLPARALSQATRAATGIEIHPAARLGDGVFIDHGMGVVIGETARVGDDVTIYHGVTLGGTSLDSGDRHPTIGDRVTIGAGAKVLGNLSVGHDSRIGANAVLVRTVPENSVVVGVPGQVIARSVKHTAVDLPDLANADVPDPVGATVHSLVSRMDRLETAVTGQVERSLYVETQGVWQEAPDFSI
jgi:serine O-acetyltransferase